MVLTKKQCSLVAMIKCESRRLKRYGNLWLTGIYPDRKPLVLCVSFFAWLISQNAVKNKIEETQHKGPNLVEQNDTSDPMIYLYISWHILRHLSCCIHWFDIPTIDTHTLFGVYKDVDGRLSVAFDPPTCPWSWKTEMQSDNDSYQRQKKLKKLRPLKVCW